MKKVNQIFKMMPIFSLILLLFSCSFFDSNFRESTPDFAEKSNAVVGGDKEKIRSIILSLPEFRYHEETRDDFKQRLIDSSFLPENQKTSANYLYVTGGGSFSPREFIWDQRMGILTVIGEDIEMNSRYLDKWRRVNNQWIEQ